MDSKYYINYTGDNSYSIFEKDRLNEYGERFCVVAQVSYEEAHNIYENLNKYGIPYGDPISNFVDGLNEEDIPSIYYALKYVIEEYENDWNNPEFLKKTNKVRLQHNIPAHIDLMELRYNLRGLVY